MYLGEKKLNKLLTLKAEKHYKQHKMKLSSAYLHF